MKINYFSLSQKFPLDSMALLYQKKLLFDSRIQFKEDCANSRLTPSKGSKL